MELSGARDCAQVQAAGNAGSLQRWTFRQRASNPAPRVRRRSGGGSREPQLCSTGPGFWRAIGLCHDARSLGCSDPGLVVRAWPCADRSASKRDAEPLASAAFAANGWPEIARRTTASAPCEDARMNQFDNYFVNNL